MENTAYISVPKSLRYSISGNTVNPTKVLFALHGYGQLVPYFIRKFNGLPSDIIVVAPEGPHRFYLQGSSGRVGASWMTKEEREFDIKDNITYLDLVRNSILEQYPTIHSTILLGFSQGGATAARWQVLGNRPHDALILWASVFPPDLEEERNLSSKRSFFALGNEDEYYSEEDAVNIKLDYEERGFEIVSYKGKHDINSEVLLEIITQLGNNH